MRFVAECPVRLVPVHRRLKSKSKHAADLVVEFFRRIFSGFDQALVRIGQEIVVVGTFRSRLQSVGQRTELQIHSVDNCLFRVVDTAPVGNDRALVAPLPAQHVDKQEFVVAGMPAVVKVISTHNRPGIAPLNRRLERRKIDFAHRPFVNYDIRRMAARLLVVEGIVLHACRHSVLLKADNIGNRHF